MDYPDNFETPAFPAGKRIAVSRVLAIAASVIFLLTVAVCGLIVWSEHSVRIHPFLISVDELTGQWAIVGHSHGDRAISAWQALQESVIGNFAENWFEISLDTNTNNARWAECAVAKECGTNANRAYGDETCALACATNATVMQNFRQNIMPKYQLRSEMRETWTLNTSSMTISPIDPVSQNGGTWQIQATVMSNDSGPISVIAYARVARDKQIYPTTMGFYIADFNAYRLN